MAGSEGQLGKGYAAPPKRPRELEDALNYYLYHPLAWRLARLLAATPLTPNMVSIIGGGMVAVAGVVYAQPCWPWSALAGLALHMGWHVVDGADGDLARITGRASPFGEMVDGICDYASHVVLYLILGWLLAHHIGWVAYPLMLAAGVSHVIQANHVEVERRSYQWWVYDIPWLRHTREKADVATRRGVFGALVSLYMRVGARFAGSTRRIDQAVDAAAGNPDARERIRQAARTEAPHLLRILKLLGPNPRAIVLGVSMLLGSPLWFFLFEVIGLNLLLAVSIRQHEAAVRRMEAAIARQNLP